MLSKITNSLMCMLVLLLICITSSLVYPQNDKQKPYLQKNTNQPSTHKNKFGVIKQSITNKDYSPKIVKSIFPIFDNLDNTLTSVKNASINGEVLDNRGKDFWICFEQNYDNSDISFKLFISSEVNTNCTISIPYLNWEQSYSVTAREITTVELPNPTELAVSTSEVIENKGIRISSDDEVTVYGINQKLYTTDAYLALPVDILNQSYIIVSYTGLGADMAQPQFCIVSPYDNVNVEITPSADTEGGQSAGQTFSITLNKGETYQVQAYGQELTGSVVQSSLPVAVFAGNSCANVPPSYCCCDILVEQLPPVNTWGNSFYTQPLQGRSYGDTFRIIASQDNTEIIINNVNVATLNFADYYELVLDFPSSIISNNPILVMQFSNGSEWDSSTGDPFMMMIPPTEQFMSVYSFATPSSGFPNNYINVIIRTDGISTLLLDGKQIDPALFNQINSENVSSGSIPIDIGTHRIENFQNIPFGIYSYGFSDYDSYGYAGGLSLEYIYGGSAPIIALDQETIGLINQAQVEGVGLTIKTTIIDTKVPYTQSAKLYYQKVNDQNFSEINMSNTAGNSWAAEIPSNDVVTPGLKFYVYASDGQLSSTNPSISPVQNAHNIAVLPNQLPVIEHNAIKRTTPGKDILIIANIIDETYKVETAELFYRKPGGNPSYTSLGMNLNQNEYSATIPGSDVTTQGIEYYIRATDDFGLSSYSGSADFPFTIIVKNTMPLIFVPGIMGSPLYDDINSDNKLYDNHIAIDDELIWIDKWRLQNGYKQKYLYALKLDESGGNALNPINNIKVAPIRGDVNNSLIKNFDKDPLSIYKDFFEYFQNKGYDIDDTKLLNASPNTDLFCFTYDWRKSVKWNGEHLSSFIDFVKQCTGADKVNIVAHSLGGLVTKSCIKDKDFGDDRINKLIFIGTPHLGAPQIYYTMLTGDTEMGWYYLVLNADWFISNSTIREITRNMPSVYQLFPSNLYFDTSIGNGGSGADAYSNSLLKAYYTPFLSDIEYLGFQDGIDYFISLEENGTDRFNQTLIEAAVTEQNQLENVDFGNIDVFNIVGYGSPTVGNVGISYFYNSPYDHVPFYNLDGDGTVPLKSAETINKSVYKPDKTFYINKVKHSSLPSNETVDSIIEQLINNQTEVTPYPLPQNYSYSNFNLWQTIIACPVVVNVYDKDGNHTGPTSDSTSVQEIPGSKYVPADLNDPTSKKIFLLPANGSYRFEIISQDTTSKFDFKIYQFAQSNLKSIVSFDSVGFGPNTKAFCQLDSISSNLTIDVDLDGNGSIDTSYISHYDILTSIKNSIKISIASDYWLSQNHPNPFNPNTLISYSLPKSGFVELKVFNLLGQEVATLVNEQKAVGTYEVNFNASTLPSGVYIYKIQAGEFVQTKKMILLK